jgi:signal transduction histidine kinase
MDAEFFVIALFFFALGCAIGKMIRAAAVAKEIEARVAERTKTLASTYEAQSKFLADISHELQTPIAILRGNVEILEQRVAPAEAKAAVRVITATLDSMARLVNSVLEGVRLKFSKNRFVKTDVAVGVLLEEVHEDCLVLAQDRDVALACASDEMMVLGDRDKLKEVLLNLISNALKHTPRGGTISLIGTRRSKLDGDSANHAGNSNSAAGWAEIAVEDTGCGIPPEQLPSIFERFYRIDSDGITGTGIGLYLCRQIVEAHDGTITVESEPGKGSRFVVRIPLRDLV